MKNIPIKFRADSAIGEIFGWYVERENKPYILSSGGAYVSVDKDSVTQLIGYDVDGKEIYEGDILVSSGGNEFTAELWAMGANALDADVINNGMFNFTLKA